jgi:hypothetical protein
MAKNPNIWMIRINPSSRGKNLPPTKFARSATTKVAHIINVPWYGIAL